MYEIKVAGGCFDGEAVPCRWIKGSNFQVLLFNKYVVKIPIENNSASGIKNKKNTRTIKEISDLQNELYAKFPEYTIPSYYYADFLISPRPKGEVPTKNREELKKRVLDIHRKIIKAGYELGDVEKLSNYLYDKGTDKITIIDYSHLQRI